MPWGRFLSRFQITFLCHVEKKQSYEFLFWTKNQNEAIGFVILLTSDTKLRRQNKATKPRFSE